MTAIRREPVFRRCTGGGWQDGSIRVGELAQKSTHWEFTYDKDYLERGDDAWELDPCDIRLKRRKAFKRQGATPFPVFCDVALSGWSSDVLEENRSDFLGHRAGAEPWGWWEKLLYAPIDGFGALSVGESGAKPVVADLLTQALSSQVTRKSWSEVALKPSSGAMGGEKPKVTACAWSTAGALLIMPVLFKFAVPSQRPDSVIAEATALTLADELGLGVPEHSVASIAGVPALSIARFDRGLGGDGPVFHCISASTALGLPSVNDDDDPRRSYVALASILKKSGDAMTLFRRIVLNAAVGNGDDHPGNTSLRQMGLQKWELSPLYDVMPCFHRNGVPAFKMAINRNGTRRGSRQNLVMAGQQIAGLQPAQAEAAIDEVFTQVRNRWRQVFGCHSRGLPFARADDWRSVFEPDGVEG
jgi:serine/threonine-protein kinase HipA